MRTFIAIDIGETVAANIGGLQDELRGFFGQGRRGVKWVDPGLIHLTLKFLGEVDDDQIVEVCKVVEDVTTGFGEFCVEVEKVGSFGRPPRVIWIGTQESEALCRLWAGLDARLAEIGFAPDEKMFVPHLTLCRVKDFAAGRRFGRIIGGFDDFSAGKIDVKSVCVYKSELTKTGPEYTLLSYYNLD
ncbi:MAG: RNA 2',3'-cyclic phosphodiesterase [Planctomycetes bacterium]|nr:RNA 2',3'-cyclic phosphodiesterase [Planctomycetota bacterium]